MLTEQDKSKQTFVPKCVVCNKPLNVTNTPVVTMNPPENPFIQLSFPACCEEHGIFFYNCFRQTLEQVNPLYKEMLAKAGEGKPGVYNS